MADFGVARVKAQTGVMTAETGTYRWMAPEVLHFYQSFFMILSLLGLVLYLTCTGLKLILTQTDINETNVTTFCTTQKSETVLPFWVGQITILSY